MSKCWALFVTVIFLIELALNITVCGPVQSKDMQTLSPPPSEVAISTWKMHTVLNRIKKSIFRFLFFEYDCIYNYNCWLYLQFSNMSPQFPSVKRIPSALKRILVPLPLPTKRALFIFWSKMTCNGWNEWKINFQILCDFLFFWDMIDFVHNF